MLLLVIPGPSSQTGYRFGISKQEGLNCRSGTSGLLACTFFAPLESGMSKPNENLPPELERYLALCERLYHRMVSEGRWPWPDEPDSTDSADMVESGDNPNYI